MNEQTIETRGGVFSRALLLYGLYTLLSNAFFLIGYYLLPESFMRGSPRPLRERLRHPRRRFGPSLP
jgi:hypothetical protein